MITFTAVRGATVKVVVTLVSLALTVVGLGFVSSSSSTAQETTTVSLATRWSPDRYESRVRYFINRKRKAHNLVALRAIHCADRTAGKWTHHLADTDTFYHQDMGQVINKCDASWAGETLGRGDIGPRVLVRMWMDSPGHRDILLSKHPRRIGIGALVESHGQWLTTANFVRR